ncbi:hypothetical protein lerEdw1_001858 [Lerista edwardsae]|nr:hypothetical protein lerEdw1_001858 [Lerista edwardsae]
MASQVTARQYVPLKYLKPTTEPLHKMQRKQHESLLKRMYMPFVRGPEDRHYFTSFQDRNSNAFLKSHPFVSPEDKNFPLVPHRDDVPIINTFSGFLSPGAAVEIDQQNKYRRTAKPLGDGQDVQHPQGVPDLHESSQTAYRRPSLSFYQQSQDRGWNTRAVPDIHHRAQVGGWINPVKVIPAPPPVKECFSPHTFVFNVDPDSKSSDPSETCRDEKALKYMYTSTTQRAYEDIPWDKMLPPKPQPPDSTLEQKADDVSHCFAIKQYEPSAEISQVSELYCNVLCVSPSSRTQHIPLYTGRVGADNPEDIDNPYVDLITHGNVRTTKPRYVMSSYKPNTFGYTGKVHWSAIQPANSNLPPTSPSIISQMHGYMAKHGQPTEFPHLGPLSQLLTPTEPQNSFNRKEKERIKI